MASTILSTEDARQSLSDKGFVCWEDSAVGDGIQAIAKSGFGFVFFSKSGLEFCKRHLLNTRILSIVQSFFGDDPCVLGHCLRYGAYPGHILCFRSGGGPQVLVVHLLAKESQVCYYGGSHQHKLPVEEGKRLLYETTPSELDAKDCIPVEWKFPRGGLAVFDARLFFEIEKGYAITYEFATAEVVQNWKKMFLPSSKELKEKLVELEDHLEDRKIRMNFAFGDTT